MVNRICQRYNCLEHLFPLQVKSANIQCYKSNILDSQRLTFNTLQNSTRNLIKIYACQRLTTKIAFGGCQARIHHQKFSLANLYSIIYIERPTQMKWFLSNQTANFERAASSPPSFSGILIAVCTKNLIIYTVIAKGR